MMYKNVKSSSNFSHNIQSNLTDNTVDGNDDVANAINDVFFDNSLMEVTACEPKNIKGKYDNQPYKGKGVVLVDSDKPWFLGDDIDIPVFYPSDVQRNEKVKPTPTRIMKPKAVVGKTKTKENQMYIILLLLVAVVVMVLYKIMRR